MRTTSLLYTALLFAFLTGCQAPAPTPAPTDCPSVYPYTFSTTHFGKLTPGMPEADAVAAYGTEELVAGTLYGPEGIEYEGHRLYSGTDAEADVNFFPGNDQEPASVRVEITGQGSPWREATTGLGVGTTLRELVRLNGAPITFFGFGWDYGGTVTDYHGGALAGTYALALDVEYESLEEEVIRQLSGDRELRSDDPSLEEARVWVSRVGVLLE